MFSVVWENAYLDDLIMVTEMIDDCAKLQFVHLIEKVETRFIFNSGRIIRTTIRPIFKGLVYPREVESVMKEPAKMQDGSVVSVGIGLHSPLLAGHIQNSDFLKFLASEPPSKGKVRSLDHTSAWPAFGYRSVEESTHIMTCFEFHVPGGNSLPPTASFQSKSIQVGDLRIS